MQYSASPLYYLRSHSRPFQWLALENRSWGQLSVTVITSHEGKSISLNAILRKAQMGQKRVKKRI